MKLCFIANPNNADVLRWTENLTGRGNRVFFIGEHPPHKGFPDGIDFIDLTKYTNIHKLRYPRWGLIIRKILKEVQPDILHTFGVASSGWLGLLAGFHPWVVTATGTDLLYLKKRSWLHQQLSILALNQADFVLCVSNQLRQFALDLGIQENKVGISIFGVNDNVFHPIPDRSLIRQKLGLENIPTIISIRAIQAIYNPLDIARAIPIVLQKAPNAQFLIFTYHADPTLLSHFKFIINESGANRAVIYVADLPNDLVIAEYLQASDIAISVPSSDGTPSSVLESMACGTAMIVSDLPSLHEWIVQEELGLFVPTNNISAISDTILRLIFDPNLRLKIGMNASQAIKDKADQDKWINHVNDIYCQLTGSGIHA